MSVRWSSVSDTFVSWTTGNNTRLQISCLCHVFFFFSSRRRHTRLQGDWSSDVCSSDLSRARFQRLNQLPGSIALSWAFTDERTHDTRNSKIELVDIVFGKHKGFAQEHIVAFHFELSNFSCVEFGIALFELTLGYRNCGFHCQITEILSVPKD